MTKEQSAGNGFRLNVSIAHQLLGFWRHLRFGEGRWIKVARGTFWSIVGYGGGQVIRLAGHLILAKLLFPAAFGILALTSSIVAILQMASDFGIGPSVIQHPEGEDPSLLNTAWTMQVIRGFVLWGLAAGAAYPLSVALADDRLIELIPIVGVQLIIGGFVSTSLICANRRLALARITMIELASAVAATSLMIVWALVSPTVWALVAGGLCGASVRLILSHLAMPGANDRFGWNSKYAADIWSYGKWMLGTSFVVGAATHADRFLLGRHLSWELLGIYSVAFGLSVLPSQIASLLSQRVFFPAFSELYRTTPDRLGDRYYSCRFVLHSVALTLLGAEIALAPELIEILYDDRYLAASSMLQFLCVRSAILCFTMPSGSCLMALGRPQYSFYGNLCSVIVLVVGIPLAWQVANINGVLLVVVTSALPRLIAGYVGLVKSRLMEPSREIRTLPFLFLGIALGYCLTLL